MCIRDSIYRTTGALIPEIRQDQEGGTVLEPIQGSPCLYAVAADFFITLIVGELQIALPLHQAVQLPQRPRKGDTVGLRRMRQGRTAELYAQSYMRSLSDVGQMCIRDRSLSWQSARRWRN